MSDSSVQNLEKPIIDFMQLHKDQPVEALAELALAEFKLQPDSMPELISLAELISEVI